MFRIELTCSCHWCRVPGRLYRLLIYAIVASQLLTHIPMVAAQSADPLDSLIHSMSLEERVGQLFMVRFWGTDAGGTFKQLWTAIHPGAAVLIDQNLSTPQQIVQLTNGMQALAEAEQPGVRC